MWNGATDLESKTWECKICQSKYTSLEKGYGTKCWQGHELTKIVEPTADYTDILYEKEDWIVSGGCPKGGDYFADEG